MNGAGKVRGVVVKAGDRLNVPTNDPQGRTAAAGPANQQQTDRGLSYRDEIAGFCAAVRTLA